MATERKNILKNKLLESKKKRLSSSNLPKNNSVNNRFEILNKIRSILDGTFLTNESFLKQYTFVLFVSCLTLLYIAQNFYADKILLSIEREKERVRELRFEYITTSEHLSKMLQASQLKEKLKHYGIKPSVVPPVKIVIKSNTNKK